jgi:hypothetical protein
MSTGPSKPSRSSTRPVRPRRLRASRCATDRRWAGSAAASRGEQRNPVGVPHELQRPSGRYFSAAL